MKRKVIAIDFDGVIATYQDWAGEGNYGEPVNGAVSAINKFRKAGWRIIIFTARLHDDRTIMRDYLYRYRIPYDELTNVKPTTAHCFVDDRAICFRGDWEKTFQDVQAFEPYYFEPADWFSDSGSGYDNSIILVTRVHKEATNEKMQKLQDEILWLKDLPEQWRPFFPEILLSDFSQNRVSYEMPHYTLPSLRRLIISGAWGPDKVLRWTYRILNFAFEMYRHTIIPCPYGYMARMYFERAYRRLEEARDKSPVLAELIDRPEVVINGEAYPNLLSSILQLSLDAAEFVPEYISRWGHADLHFSNILIDEPNDTFRLVDPRGYLATDYYYDLGKLWHSVYSKYEMIAEGLFSIDRDRGDFKFHGNSPAWKTLEATRNKLPELMAEFSNEPYGEMMKKVEFANAIHFASIAPFLLEFDGIEEKAIAGYYTGVVECARVINRYLA